MFRHVPNLGERIFFHSPMFLIWWLLTGHLVVLNLYPSIENAHSLRRFHPEDLLILVGSTSQCIGVIGEGRVIFTLGFYWRSFSSCLTWFILQKLCIWGRMGLMLIIWILLLDLVCHLRRVPFSCHPLRIPFLGFSLISPCSWAGFAVILIFLVLYPYFGPLRCTHQFPFWVPPSQGYSSCPSWNGYTRGVLHWGVIRRRYKDYVHLPRNYVYWI